MKILVKKFLEDIFFGCILTAIVILLMVIMTKLNKYIFWSNVFLVMLGVISVIYSFKCFKHRNVDRTSPYYKFILTLRELVLIFASIFIYTAIFEVFSALSDLSDIIRPFVVYFIAYRFLFSLLAIIIGIKLTTMLLLFLMLIPILIVLGGLDIEYWAAVTGALGLWNYINSKDFVLYLRKGKQISKIPDKLEFIWQRNKLFANFGTVIFYFSLVISSLFETDCMTLIQRTNPRLYSLLGLTVFLAIVYLFILLHYYASRNSHMNKNYFMKCILWCGKKIRLDKSEKMVCLYQISRDKK